MPKREFRPDYANQAILFDPKSFTFPVHIVGAGSIGSTVLFALSAIGVSEIHLWDADVLERHNTPTQPIYRAMSDNGTPKVSAAADFIKRQELSTKLVLHQEFVDGETPLDGVVISGVDSMDSRQKIWRAVKANLANVPLYVDGRLGGERLTLYTFLPTDWEFRKYYESRCLFDYSAGDQLPCGGRNIIGPPLAMAAIIAENLTLWHRQEEFERHINFKMRLMEFVAVQH